jgi:hypothetical protein
VTVNQQLNFVQNNDEAVTITVTDPTRPAQSGQPAPFNLTGATVKFIRKASQNVLDTDPSFKSYTATITNATQGIASVSVPAADNAIAGTTWWRVDVISGGKTLSPNYGPLMVIAV